MISSETSTQKASNNKKSYFYAIPKAILSFPHLLEKCPLSKFVKTEKDRYYSATFLLSKSDEDHVKIVEQMKADHETLVKEFRLREFKKCIKDGDDDYAYEIDEERKKKIEYIKGYFHISARNKKQPNLTDKFGEELELPRDSEIFYPSCLVHSYVEMYGFGMEGDFNKIVGITFRLHHVQFAKDGRMLGTSKPVVASSMFEKFIDTSEDIKEFEKSNEAVKQTKVKDEDLY
jgi:hypothetical protein